MLYRVLAELVLLIHFAFIVFVLVGGLAALRWRWVPWVQLPAAAWGALIELTGWICPLTPLENTLRALGGEAVEVGLFVLFDHRVIVALRARQVAAKKDGADVAHLCDGFGPELQPVALIGHGRVREAVAHHPVAAVERRADGAQQMVAPRREVQQ